MIKFMLGSDPELFLGNANGQIVSAIGRIGGSKHEPTPVPELGEGFSVQEDNVLCEYNTPPAATVGTFVRAQNVIREYLAKKVGEQGLVLREEASATMPDSELEDPRAWVFGCDPDFNAWTNEMNPRPAAADPKLRSGGGHIHIGFDGNAKDKILLCRWLDIYVGVWTASKDPDERRRELYGKAGAMRFKPYGLEYRTPSNWWTMDSQRVEAIWDLVRRALARVESNRVPDERLKKAVLAYINDGKKDELGSLRNLADFTYDYGV